MDSSITANRRFAAPRNGSEHLTHVTQTTAIIKAFERPRALARLIRSLHRFYPAMPIMVADDSLDAPAVPANAEYHRLPPDVGASAGRNYLLERVKTPYFWQLDDDFELTRDTEFELLAGPVAENRADIVAGDCQRCKRKFPGWVRTKPSPFFGNINRSNGVLRITPGEAPAKNAAYVPCDIAPQFFVARTDAVLSIGGWDADLKTEEHEEFFVRCQQRGLRTLYCPAVTIRHWSELPAHYAQYRRRSYRPLAAQKMGVHTWVDMDGAVKHYATQNRPAKSA